ncbi:hypothetical protein G4B88_002351 (mitochondrion) [Cannabis sativa]|uniref:Uncharacterized protein n=1 Tax=Cannabis sativa TaxID=3483 RepID=A0A7J6DWV6_CANSA|nr:hypothetical protein G4B88_002351 [Cannabis sativa]
MILEKWQRNVTTSMESWSPLEAFAGYAIEGGLSSGSPLLAEMNGSEGGLGSISVPGGSFPRRWKSRPAQRITGANVSPTKKSSLTISPSFPAEPPLFAIRKIPIKSKPYLSKASSVILRPQGSLLDPFPSLPHCSSKCATPYEDLLPFCPLSVHTVLKAEEEGSRSFPVHSLYISDTQGRTRWEGSSPSLCPADHSAGILHSRLRLTAARGCSCRYVSLSGSLAPPVISFYDMLLSSPYSICHLVISASLRVSTSERNGGLHSVTPRSPSERSE